MPEGAGARPALPPVVLAFLWMGGALVSFLTMGVSGRELSVELEPHHMAFYRNGICLALLAPFVVKAGWTSLRTKRPGQHVARNGVHFFAQWCWFYGLGVLPFAEVFAIEFTAPVWTALLACFFLGERLTHTRLVALALGIAGVLTILRPGVSIVDPAALVVLAAALGYATAYVLTKSLMATESSLAFLVWMNAVQLPIGGLLSVSDLTLPSQALWPWVLAIGISGLTSHYCISRALVVADAIVVVPLDFLRLPLAFLVAWSVYGEPLDPFLALGVLFILAGNLINLRRG